MPHLLDKIVDAATASEANIPHLLRLCMVLGDQLEGGELASWVHHEQNGYPDRASLPDYRRFTAPSHLMIVNRGSHATLDITEDIIRDALEDDADKFIYVSLHGSVAEIAGLAESDGPCERRWSRAATVLVARKMTEWDPFRAWTSISKSQLNSILDAVQNRVLALALQLRKQHPELGEKPLGELPSVNSEKVSQVVNNTITNTFNVTGDSANIHAPVSSVGAYNGDVEGLRSILNAAGLTEEEVEEVTAIVRQETSAQGTLAKLKKLPGALGQKALEAGIVQAIQSFFPG